MLEKLAEKGSKVTSDPQKILNVHEWFSTFATKACFILVFVVFIIGAGYIVISKMNPHMLTFFEQEQLFMAVLDEVHHVPFDQLTSARFEKVVNDEHYVCTVIMEDIANVPLDMMGDTVPGVKDPFVSQHKNYAMRPFVIEIMYLPKNLFSLPIDAEPSIAKGAFFAVKKKDGDYDIVPAAPVKEQYTEQTKIYRENVHQSAMEYIKMRDEALKKQQEAAPNAQ